MRESNFVPLLCRPDCRATQGSKSTQEKFTGLQVKLLSRMPSVSGAASRMEVAMAT